MYTCQDFRPNKSRLPLSDFYCLHRLVQAEKNSVGVLMARPLHLRTPHHRLSSPSPPFPVAIPPSHASAGRPSLMP
jgi:hypothetical protein